MLIARLVYLPIFAVTLFTASGLLFLIQPMVGKLLTPQLGATPAVWNTCLVFFQVMVLAGYFYVFFLHLVRGIRVQSLIHVLPWVAALLLVPAGWQTLSSSAAVNLETGLVGRTFWLLAVTLGLPVLVLAATAPLLQRWLAQTALPEGADPYFLYAAGSLGGLLALASYPVLIEPALGQRAQFTLWFAGLVVLAVLLLICLVLAWLAPKREATPALAEPARSIAAPIDEPAAPNWGTRFLWLACAALPASLLMGFTSHLTEDIPPMPLFWVVPLGVFLFTIVLGFWRSRAWHRLPANARIGIQCVHGLALVMVAPIALVLAFAGLSPAWVTGAIALGLVLIMPYRWVRVAQPIGIALFFITLSNAGSPLGVAMIGLQLLCFFLTVRVCHRELARSRPTAPYLTGYYLWMGLGGILGGLFNLFVAPLLFRSSYLEYPLVMILAAAIRPPYLHNGLTDWICSCAIEGGRRVAKGARPLHRTILAWAFDFGIPVLLSLVLWLIFAAGTEFKTQLLRKGAFRSVAAITAAEASVYVLAMLVCLAVLARPVRFALCLVAALVWHAVYLPIGGDDIRLHVERTSFGILRVMQGTSTRGARPEDGQTAHRYLMHGTTYHGMNFTAPNRSRLATTYYHREGPLGIVLERYNWLPGPTDTYAADAVGVTALVGMLGQTTLAPLPAMPTAPWAEPAIAVLGLGTGTIASYARPMQRMDFFEVDPAVIRLCEPSANGPPLFRYVEEARQRGAEINLFPGDGRLSLAQHGPEGYYQVIVVDAFSSDAIPVHLITREAIELYLTKLAPGGIICFHTSNRYVDLPPALGDLARSLRLACLLGRQQGGDDQPLGMFSSEWVLLARDARDLDPVRRIRPQVPLEWAQPVASSARLWTDDFTDLPGAFRPDQQRFALLFTDILFTLIGLMVLVGLAGFVLEVVDAALPRQAVVEPIANVSVDAPPEDAIAGPALPPAPPGAIERRQRPPPGIGDR